MSFLRKAALVNGTAFACLALGILQTAVLSRALGPDGVGQYSVIMSALMLAGPLSAFGFPLSFLYHSQRDPTNTRVYLMNAIWATTVLGTLGGAVLMVLIWGRPGYFGQVPWFVLLLILVCVPIMLHRCISRNGLLILIEARRLSFISLSSAIVSVGLISVLGWLGLLTVGQAVLCFFAAETTRAIIGWFWIRTKIDFSIQPSWNTTFKLGLMGVRLGWSDLMVLVNAQINTLVIRYLLTDFESVGYYNRGERVAMLAATAGETILPMLFSRWAALPQQGLAAHVEKTMRFASSAGLLMVAGILLLGKWIVLVLYGQQFLPAVAPMAIMAPGAVFYLLSSALVQLLCSRGSPEPAAIMLFAGTMATAVLSWLLIPLWGINGAALALTIANIALLGLLMGTAKIKYGVRIRQCVMLKSSDVRSIRDALRARG